MDPELMNDLGEGESTQRPLDAVVAGMMGASLERHQGFVLRLARELDPRIITTEDGALEVQGGDLAIRVDPPLPAIPDVFERPPAWRDHALGDVDALVEMARRYGDHEASIVFYDNEGAELVLNDEPEGPAREVLALGFNESADLASWRKLMDREITHRELFRGLLRLTHTMADPALLASMRSIRATWTADVASDLRDDGGGTTGVVYNSNAGTELVAFPKAFLVAVPVLDFDLGQGQDVSLEIRVEVLLPESSGEGVRFVLTCPLLENQVRERVDDVANGINRALGDDWAVVRGQSGWKDRPIGLRENGLEVRR